MEQKKLTEKERYYSVIDCNGNFELRDYECGKTIHSLFELDDLLNRQDKCIKELDALTRELNFDFAQTKERLQALQDYYTNSIEMLEEERKNILSKLNSDESFSLQTYRSLQRRLSEKTLKIEVFAQFINDLYMLEVEI